MYAQQPVTTMHTIIRSDPQIRNAVFDSAVRRWRTLESDPLYLRYIHGDFQMDWEWATVVDYRETGVRDIFERDPNNPVSFRTLAAYVRDPSPRTAAALLRILAIPVPFEKVTVVTDSRSSKKRRTKGGGQAVISPTLREAMVVTDALHDLRDALCPRLRDWVIGRQSVFSKKQITTTRLTHSIGDAWIRAAGMSPTRDFTRDPSEQLWHLLRRWTSAPEFTLVFDGILDKMNVLHMVETAIVLLMFSNGSKAVYGTAKDKRLSIPRTLDTKLHKLVLVDGFFNELDYMRPMLPFLQRYANALSGIVGGEVSVCKGADEGLSTIFSQPITLKPNMRSYGSVADIVLPSGTVVPYRGAQNACRFVGKRDLWLPYRKEDMMNFVGASLQKTDYAPKPTTARYLGDVMEINFFRDAFRADVALQKGWGFITHDRLAFLFYSLSASTHDLPQLGMHVWQSDRGDTVTEFLLPVAMEPETIRVGYDVWD